MKILGISCSPRPGGNTEILVKEALTAAKKAGAETEFVSIIGKNIAPCDGCGICRQIGSCVVEDDMQQILRQMEQADAILLGSPVYLLSVSAQAKIIMDRTNVFLKDKRLKLKVGAPIIAVRRVGGGMTRTLLYNFFISHGMITVKGALGYGMDPGDVEQGVGGAPGSTALGEARDTAREVMEMVTFLQRPKDY